MSAMGRKQTLGPCGRWRRAAGGQVRRGRDFQQQLLIRLRFVPASVCAALLRFRGVAFGHLEVDAAHGRRGCARRGGSLGARASEEIFRGLFAHCPPPSENQSSPRARSHQGRGESSPINGACVIAQRRACFLPSDGLRTHRLNPTQSLRVPFR